MISVMGATSDSRQEETSSGVTLSLMTSSVTEKPIINKIKLPPDLEGSIDLLAALQLHNTTYQGVKQVPGLVRLKPAYYLQGEYISFKFYFVITKSCNNSNKKVSLK